MLCKFLPAVLSIFVTLTAPALLLADDEAPAAKFTKLRDKWRKLEGSAKTLADEYRSADPKRQAEIKKQIGEAAAELRTMRPLMAEVARAAYAAKPNDDEKVIKTLISTAMMDFHNDDYEQLLKTAKLLVQHDCKADGILALAGIGAYCTNDFEAAETYFEAAKAADGSIAFKGDRYFRNIEQAKKNWAAEAEIRAQEAKADDLPRVKLTTSEGVIELELFENEAPQAVANFVHLVQRGFYDDLTFHRVLRNFMAQGGCPDGNGRGGPGYQIFCECHQDNHRKHFRGTLSMAHAGKNTGGSQFFITFLPTAHLDGNHTAFGRIVKGMDVLGRLQRIDPSSAGEVEPDKILTAEVIRIRDHEYIPTKVE